jgi:UDP-N-acetylmuramyl tripeptide synthase
MEEPTKLRPVGLLSGADGRVLNVADYALPDLPANDTVTVFGVLGASMNSGKTTAASSLAHGLKRAGHAVAGVKATGTGAFRDFNSYEDAGAAALDFTDVGMATTFRMPLERIERGFDTLVATAAARGAEVVVVEIADGVFQQETRAILRVSGIRDRLAIGRVGSADPPA